MPGYADFSRFFKGVLVMVIFVVLFFIITQKHAAGEGLIREFFFGPDKNRMKVLLPLP